MAEVALVAMKAALEMDYSMHNVTLWTKINDTRRKAQCLGARIKRDARAGGRSRSHGRRARISGIDARYKELTQINESWRVIRILKVN